MLKHILWAAIGAGAGYYVATKHLEAKFDARLQSEVEQTRAFYKTLYEEKLKREIAQLQTEISDEAVDIVVAETKKVLAADGDIPKQAEEVDPEPEELPEEAAVALVNYQGISAASGETEPVGGIRRIIDRTAEEEELTYVKPNGPRLITFEQYSENAGDYVQQTVVYYAEDQKVSDEVDQELDNRYIGRNISYANLATMGENNKTIWIRNDKDRIDHEVIWSAKSFAVDVLGEDPKK